MDTRTEPAVHAPAAPHAEPDLARLARGYLVLAWAGVVLLGAVEVVNFALGHRYWAVLGRFFLNGEANIPTWFSSLLSASCALAFGLLHLRRTPEERASRLFRWVWLGLAGLMLFLSVDETAMLHEEYSRIMAKYVHGQSADPSDNVATPGHWVYLYLPAAGALIALGAYYVLRYVPNRRLRLWWLAGAALLVVAIVGEKESWLGLRHSQGTYIVEECAEMAAPLCLFAGAMSEYRRRVLAALGRREPAD